MASRSAFTCAIVALAIPAFVGDTAHGQGRLRRLVGLVPPPTPDKFDIETDDDAPDGTRSVVLPDNGDLRRKLEQVRQQIDGEHFADAGRQLGQFLQDPQIHDFFLSRDDQRRDGRSFLAEVRCLLRDLPAAGKLAYREQFDAVARARLGAAAASGDEAALRDVAARFPQTRAGDEALYRLGHYLRDHGWAHAAAACLARLQARPEAAATFEPALSQTLAACRADSRDDRRAQSVDWPSFRGDPARNGSVAAGAPFLAPRWSRQTTSDTRTTINIERAWQSYCDGTGSALPLLSPLAVGDLVITRTSRGLAAFDLVTGESRWKVPSDDEGENVGLDSIIWQEPAGGAFSADEECVYLVDSLLAGDAHAPIVSHNTLVAREHFHAREGKLRWQVGGRDGGMEARLAGAFFLGPPLAWQGGLFALVESHGALSLVALDRLTGRLAWSQELALVEQRISQDCLRLIGGAMPSISPEEVMVCPTSGGVVVALDLTTRSLLWAYRYVQKTPSQPAPVDESDAVPRLDQFDRWLDGTVSIAKGRVVLTPLESREIHCLALEDGRPLWTKARDDGMFVAGITDQAVVVVGRNTVREHRLSDGEVAWRLALAGETRGLAANPLTADRDFSAGEHARDEHRPPGAGSFPAGRGVFTGDRYYLPVTTAAVLEIELSTGLLLATHKSPRELPAGNLIWHQGLFISQGPARLEVFDECQALVDQVRTRLEQNPLDADALLRRGELELAAGRVAQAITTFRAAHQAVRSSKTKSRLIGALLDGLRQNLPDHESLAAELDTLIGP
jgi:outer membrane protein assembly factor BamB